MDEKDIGIDLNKEKLLEMHQHFQSLKLQISSIGGEPFPQN